MISHYREVTDRTSFSGKSRAHHGYLSLPRSHRSYLILRHIWSNSRLSLISEKSSIVPHPQVNLEHLTVISHYREVTDRTSLSGTSTEKSPIVPHSQVHLEQLSNISHYREVTDRTSLPGKSRAHHGYLSLPRSHRSHLILR